MNSEPLSMLVPIVESQIRHILIERSNHGRRGVLSEQLSVEENIFLSLKRSCHAKLLGSRPLFFSVSLFGLVYLDILP